MGDELLPEVTTTRPKPVTSFPYIPPNRPKVPAPVSSAPSGDPMMSALLARLGTPQPSQDPMQFLQVLQSMGLLGRGARKSYIDGSHHVSAADAARGGQMPSGSSRTSNEEWAKLFPNKDQHSWDGDSANASDRMNKNLGFTPDMTPEQRRGILANITSARTGKPVESYLPEPPREALTTSQQNGSTTVKGKSGVAWTNPWATPTSGSIDGVSLTPQRTAQAESKAYYDGILAHNKAAGRANFPGMNPPNFMENIINTLRGRR